MALISYRYNKDEPGSILKYTKNFPNITTRKAKNPAALCNIPVKTGVGAQSLLEAGALDWGQFGGDAKGVHAVRLQRQGEHLCLKGLAVITVFTKVC